MKAVFIDAKNKTVTDVDVPKTGTLEAWYKIIGCELVEVAMYINDENDSILVDEEGLLSVDSETPFFFYKDAPQPYAGNGLIVGVDDEGDSVSCHVTASDIRPKIIFLTAEQSARLFK